MEQLLYRDAFCTCLHMMRLCPTVTLSHHGARMSNLFTAILKWFVTKVVQHFNLNYLVWGVELPNLAVKYSFHSARANGIVASAVLSVVVSNPTPPLDRSCFLWQSERTEEATDRFTKVGWKGKSTIWELDRRVESSAWLHAAHWPLHCPHTECSRLLQPLFPKMSASRSLRLKRTKIFTSLL